MTYQYFRCNHCKKAAPAGAWNNATLPLCKSREQKRGYKKIQLSKGTNRYYVCPCCGEHSLAKHVVAVLESELLPGDLLHLDGRVYVKVLSPPVEIGPGKPIATWAELALEVSRTHRLEIDIEGGNGWIIPNEPGKEHYLSTHTFYGLNYLESTKLLQDCGFYVVLANWDADGFNKGGL